MKTKKKGKNRSHIEIYIAANRKGSRDAELENSPGFKSVHKVHKSKKTYNRKSKNNSNYDYFSYFFCI